MMASRTDSFRNARKLDLRVAASTFFLCSIPLLSGCVAAAAAIPVVAGATMAGSLSRGEVSVAEGSSTAPEAANVEIAAVEARELPAPASQRAANRPPPDIEMPDGVTLLPLTELPPPSGASPFAAKQQIDAFAAYALAQATAAPSEAARPSALLVDPASLNVQRMDCGARPPAVLIDLDPGREAADPLAPLSLDPQMKLALASLRDANIAIVWISRLGESFAEPLKEQLIQGGFDPAGSDRLLLLRSLEDRKQTRREELAKTHCVVAMLGDARYDFDELYLYLKNEDAALALERMIGQGWFLLPEPAAAEIDLDPQDTTGEN